MRPCLRCARREVLIYDDDDDAFAHSPSVALLIRPPSTALPSRAYAAEAVMYILRGHSITEPSCQCAHGLSDARARQLGVTPDAMRGPHCSLPRHPSVSLMSLERELVRAYLARADAKPFSTPVA